jgi:hypothetical protein
MARLRFIHGAITGKLGEFVGSRWKGINYIKTFSPPSNPRTAEQISIRLVFKAVSLFATALFGKGLLDLVPPARRMTERNSVFHANKQMFTSKTFNAADLQISRPNHPAVCKILSFSLVADAFRLSAQATLPEGVDKNGLPIIAFVYDAVKGVICGVLRKPVTDFLGQTYNIAAEAFDAPSGFGTPNGSQAADCRVYMFVAGLSADQKKLISATISAPFPA